MPRPDALIQNLVAQLRRQVTTSFLPGERMPTIRALAATWGVGAMTVQRALQRLAREGLLHQTHRNWILPLDRAEDAGLSKSDSRRVGVISALSRDEWGASPFYELLAVEARRQGIELVEVPHPRTRRSTPEGSRIDLSRVPWRLFDVGLLVDTEDSETLSDRRLSRRCVLAVDRDATSYGLDSVVFDNVGAGRLAAQHLLELGHRRLAVTDEVSEPGWPSEQTWLARRHGFESAAAFAGGCISPEWRLAIPRSGLQRYQFDALRAAIKRWGSMPRKRRPTALFCFSDSLLKPIVEELTANGLNVPRDLSLVSIAGKIERPPSGGPYTVVWLNPAALARRALNAVRDMAPEKDLPARREPRLHLTSLLLVPGRSTCAPGN